MNIKIQKTTRWEKMGGERFMQHWLPKEILYRKIFVLDFHTIFWGEGKILAYSCSYTHLYKLNPALRILYALRNTWMIVSRREEILKESQLCLVGYKGSNTTKVCCNILGIFQKFEDFTWRRWERYASSAFQIMQNSVRGVSREGADYSSIGLHSLYVWVNFKEKCYVCVNL